MKNYLARFGLSTDANADAIESALSAQSDVAADTLSLTEGKKVLTDPLTHKHYKRLHLQYQAMAAAVDCMQHTNARNTHRWQERLIEYPVDDETLENL